LVVATCISAGAVMATDFVTPVCHYPGGCLQFSPSAPSSRDQIVALAIISSGLPPGACVKTVNTRLTGQTVHIDTTYGTAPGIICFPFGVFPNVTTVLQPLTPGTYAVEFTAQPDAAYGIFGWVLGPSGWVQAPVLITASLDVVPAPLNNNYQGLWWDLAEPGWGVNLAHQGDQIYLTWYTYEETGRALWLSMLASKTDQDVYTGNILGFRGPPLASQLYTPPPTSNVAGSGTLTFSDANHGTFSYTVNSITQTKSITQFVFGSQPVCTFGPAPDFAAATNYQDLWWNAAESGWGINLAHQGSQVYATWYTYDTDGSPLWLASLMSPSGPGMYTGSLLRFTGPAFSAVPFAPPPAVTTVGNATLTFANGNSGTWSYTVGATSGNKPLTRFLFAAPAGTLCH